MTEGPHEPRGEGEGDRDREGASRPGVARGGGVAVVPTAGSMMRSLAPRRVLVTGDGAAFGIAHFASLTLDRIRGQTDLVRATSENAGRLVDIGPNDVILAFTFPPYALSVLRAVRWAKQSEARIVAVTDSPISPVGQLADVALPTHVSGIGPQNTLVAAMAVANALLNGLVLRYQEPALKRYGTVSKLMEAWEANVLKAGDE